MSVSAEESKEISEWFIASVCKLWVIFEKKVFQNDSIKDTVGQKIKKVQAKKTREIK